MSLVHDQWQYTDADGRRRYFRANATVFVDTSINERCRWETIEPRADGVADDVWDAMYAADTADGYVWKCPHCDDPDPDGELHMYCGQDLSHLYDHDRRPTNLAAAVEDLEEEAERMRQTLRGILVFVPPPDMTVQQVVDAYREHARQGLEGFDEYVED